MGKNNLRYDPEWSELGKRYKKPRNHKQATAIAASSQQQSRRVSDSYKMNDTKLVGHADKKDVHVSLHLRLPSIPKPSPRQLKTFALATAILLISIGGAAIIRGINHKDSVDTDKNGVLADSSTEPQFQVILPQGKDEDAVGGLHRVSPPGTAPVFTFVDELETSTIRVSQQQLPEDFKDNPDDKVRKLAESFSATEVINESNPRAYLGTNARGPQTVIFHKNDLLIIINSDKTVEKGLWAEYITKLL